MIDREYTVCEIIEDQKVECCELIEDQKFACCEVIEYNEVVFREIIEYKNVELIEDINMLKLSGNESHGIKKLNLSKKELKIIARERGVKNYENISKRRLIKEINKLKSSKGLKKLVMTGYYLKSTHKKLIVLN